MPTDDFCHLHVHTDHSLIDSVSTTQELANRVAELGQTACAITDHGTMSGAIEWSKACQKAGVKPLIGCELYMAPGERGARGADAYHRVVDPDTGEAQKAQHHLTVVAISETGYRNLARLNTRAWLEGFYYRPRVDWELLQEHHEGLVVGTGCLSSLTSWALRQGRRDSARTTLGRLAEIFGREHVFAEIMDHGIPEERQVARELVQLAKEMKIPIAATNDSHYTFPHQAPVHTAWRCAKFHKTLRDPGNAPFQGEGYWVKSRTEMAALFPDLPEALNHTLAIAEMAEPNVIPFSAAVLPRFPLPGDFSSDEEYEQAARQAMAEQVWAGARRLYGDPIPPHVQERIEYELHHIQEMGFAGYFLIVADLVNMARQIGCQVGPGRGSAAGSVVAYCMGIHTVDPIRWGLLFERFLNPGRVTMPDIDIDIDSDNRELILDYIRQRHGEDRTVRIAAFKVLAAKAAIRTAARVCEAPHVLVDKIVELYPAPVLGREFSLSQVLDGPQDQPGYQTGAALRGYVAKEPTAQQVIELARGFEGVRGEQLVHAGGVIICPGPAIEWVPLAKRAGQESSEKSICTQYDLSGVDALGLLKMDVLGLKTLSVIRNTLLSIGAGAPDLTVLPFDDAATYQMLSTGYTTGVFQMESPSIQRLLQITQPETLQHLAAVNALHRPGPMGTNMHIKYAKRKNGQEEVSYAHPDLEPILSETLGLMIYQEQMMEIARQIAGYSLSEADDLRKACAKRKADLIAHHRQRFIEGGVERGYGAELAGQLFDEIEPFADYAFNKSHAYSYTILTYWCAYLKTHWPAHYMGALLRSHQDSPDRASTYMSETRRMGIRFLPPDVNESDSTWAVSNGALLYGISSVRQVGQAACDAFLAARRERGPLTSLQDFLQLCKNTRGLTKLHALWLIAAGACRFLEPTDIGEQIAACLRFFATSKSKAIEVPEWTRDPAGRERQVLGQYVLHHPIDDFMPYITWGRLTTPSKCLQIERSVPKLQLVGVLSKIDRRVSKRGNVFFYCELCDHDAVISIMVNEQTSQECRLEEGALLDTCVVVDCQLKYSGSEQNIWVQSVRPAQPTERYLRITCPPSDAYSVRRFAHSHPGDVPLVVRVADGTGGHRDLIAPERSKITIDPGALGQLPERWTAEWIPEPSPQQHSDARRASQLDPISLVTRSASA